MDQQLFGNYQWVKKTQGNLSWKEKIHVLRNSLVPTTQHLFSQFITKKSNAEIRFQEILIPDTPYIKEAVEYVENQIHDTVLAHSWRTFYWGSFFAMDRQFDFDPEVFLISALFHDIGLGQHHPESCTCFCYHSALITEDWAKNLHYPEDKTQLVLDSICLHMNGSETSEAAIEIRMLQWGTSCDVIGQQLHSIPAQLQKEILHHYPLQNFHAYMQEQINFEKKFYPQTRTALLSNIGLNQLIQLHQRQLNQQIPQK